MKKRARKTPSSSPRKHSADLVLRYRPATNRVVTTHLQEDGTMIAEVPLRRPAWLVPPISWLIPFSRCRRVELDALGGSVLSMCDGRTSVETIIESFATRHKLSFREAQLPVMDFLRQMAQRGLIGLMDIDKDASES